MASQKGTSVFLNGKLIGFHGNPRDLVDSVREKRRRGELPFDMSVSYYKDLDEAYINSDEGRSMHPLIVVAKGEPKLTKEHVKLLKRGEIKFSDLTKEGIVEFLDAEEEENAYIASNEKELTKEHTHLEPHPSLMLGAVAAVSPFANHNASPRVVMTVAMIKQALGLYASNFNLRTDTQAHVMHYPQTPIAKTKYHDIIGLNNKAAGQNFIVAVSPFYGYNVNDAVVINKAAIERGLGRTIYYRTYEAEERRYPGGQKDRFGKPAAEIQGYRGEENYKYLDESGIIEPEVVVTGGDVLVGKTSPPRFLEEVGEFGSMLEEKRRENSEAIKRGEGGIVDKVFITEGDGGNRLVKVKTRSTMIPEFGDKFTARHGQKGVVGYIAEPGDLPFTDDGIVPDLLINPHAIPKRMTVGFLLETLGAKVGCMRGTSVDSTPFDIENELDLREELKKYGFKPAGTEVMYDGTTGERIEAEIFIGVTYYQRLKHLVANKIQARARGPVQILTRQPTEGRAREGGMRFGEMERDCLIGHGASMLLRERLLEESDKVIELVCERCGMIAVDDQIRKKKYCPICGDSSITSIEMSYAFKLLLNELKTMCVYPRLKLESKA
ncbi:DNA-directed RNA polymerase subunit B [Candidatus Micrarchaeota archaeon]|nr:DNA-directed RNA polymerase subunit B [Candidatus Micrarchaeota archaeon]